MKAEKLGFFTFLFKKRTTGENETIDSCVDNLFQVKDSVPFNQQEYDAQNQRIIDAFTSLYDLDSLAGINSIPIPKKRERLLEMLPNVVIQPEYILQRKATEHKRAGRMELAIECLRKSNELMPFSCVSYPKENYMRFIEFLKQARRFEEARKEQALLEKKHPQLFSIVIADSFKRQLEFSRKLEEDLICVHCTSICPTCSPYSMRVFSISGKDKRFPPLENAPLFLKQTRCITCNCVASWTSYLECTSSSVQKDIDFSNRPVKDERTPEQKAMFLKSKKEREDLQFDKTNYDWLWENCPTTCPKSFSAYRRMKNTNSENFQRLCRIANEKQVNLLKF